MFTTSNAAKLAEDATVIVVEDDVIVVDSVVVEWSTAKGIVAFVTTAPGKDWEKANPVNRRKDANRVLTMT
jgi:hypothetical protein